MRSCSLKGRPGRGYVEGYTFVGLMILLAVVALATTSVVQVESFAARRAAEARLIQVGAQYIDAIRAYASATPPGMSPYPEQLEDLLKDPRLPLTRRYIRRLYPDPLTGRADWGIIASPVGGVAGIYSKASGVPIKQANFQRGQEHFVGSQSYDRWQFIWLSGTTLIQPHP